LGRKKAKVDVKEDPNATPKEQRKFILKKALYEIKLLRQKNRSIAELKEEFTSVKKKLTQKNNKLVNKMHLNFLMDCINHLEEPKTTSNVQSLIQGNVHQTEEEEADEDDDKEHAQGTGIEKDIHGFLHIGFAITNFAEISIVEGN
jgi:hypothetical protein